MAFLLRALLVVTVVAIACGAGAQEGPRREGEGEDKTEADRLFDEAHVHLEAGEWEQACAKFRESMRLDTSVSTQMNIARCYAHEGKLVEAWESYNRARVLNLDTPDIARRKALDEYSEKAIAELSKRLPRLRVVVSDPPRGVVILRDGVVAQKGTAGEVFPVNPGDNEIVVSAPGYAAWSEVVVGVEGETHEIEVVLERVAPPVAQPVLPAPAPRPPPSAPSPSPPPDTEPRSNAWAWTVGALGIAALGGGAALTVVTASARSELASSCVDGDAGFECPADVYAQSDVDALVRDANGGLAGAVVLLSAGAGAVTIALVALLGGDEAESSGIQLGPTGASWSIRF